MRARSLFAVEGESFYPTVVGNPDGRQGTDQLLISQIGKVRTSTHFGDFGVNQACSHQNEGGKLVRSSDERTVKEYRVTKYDPALRGPNDEYHVDDWISFTQIGKPFRGVVLTEQEYKRVERAYIKAALAFLSESGITVLRVEGLEIRQQPLTFGEGSVLTLEQLPDVIGRILREDFWCRLQADHGFVHFGWDYYMYIGVPRPCPVAEQTASELGLYVEEFASPYHENGGN